MFKLFTEDYETISMYVNKEKNLNKGTYSSTIKKLEKKLTVATASSEYIHVRIGTIKYRRFQHVELNKRF